MIKRTIRVIIKRYKHKLIRSSNCVGLVSVNEFSALVAVSRKYRIHLALKFATMGTKEKEINKAITISIRRVILLSSILPPVINHFFRRSLRMPQKNISHAMAVNKS
jgi:hypothetical protein